MTINYRKFLSNTLKAPQLLQHKVYQNFPSVFGFEIKNNLVQFYRNDAIFKTVFSFNHFIEFFSQFPDLDMKVSLQAYDRFGCSLGLQSFTLSKKGAAQIFLNELFVGLDEYGMFSASLKLKPNYLEKLFYLGTIAPQFMTLYIPLNENNSPQMVHSHKHQQGYLWTPRNHVRHSGHVEILKDLNKFQVFVLNSCNSRLNFKMQLFNSRTNEWVGERKVDIEGYATACLTFNRSEFENSVEGLSFKYYYNLSVDHKKPIIFRHFKNNNWSCNHT